MKKNDELFTLIKSLNTGEKGYFKKFSRIHGDGSDNKYLRLFNCISNMKEYDEVPVKKEFKGEKLLNQLGVAKHYLHESILNALVNYHKDNSETAKLNHLLALAETTFLKSDFNKCFTMIEKGKRLALEHEKYHHLLCFYLCEINLGSKLGIQFDELLKIYQQRALVEQTANAVSELNFCAVKIITLLNECDYKPDKKQKEKLAPLFEEIKGLELKCENSFNARIKYLEVCRNYEFFVNGNRQKAAQLSELSVELFEKHPEKIAAMPWNYITLLLGNTEFYTGQRMEEKALLTSAKIKPALDLYRKILGEPSYRILFGGFIKARLSTLLYARKYTEATKHIEQYEKFVIDKNSGHRPPEVRLFYFYAATSRLFTDRPDMALDILQNLIPQIEKDTNRQMRLLACILELLAQYQHGNAILLPHLLKSLQRWNKAYYNKATGAFPIFAAFIRQLGNVAGHKQETRNTLLKYQKKFSAYFTHSEDTSMLEGHIDIAAWIDLQLAKA